MEVVGSGLIARYLTSKIGERHPNVTAIAAGVSRTAVTSTVEFDREANLVVDVVRRCRRLGRLVLFFSTASVHMYGPDSAGTETGPVFPISAYGRHKLGLEAMLKASDTEWLALRLSHVVGSGQKGHQVVPSLVQQVRSGLVTVYRDAHRDLIDARHVVWALDRMLADGVRDEVVNMASGRPEPIARILSAIEARVGLVARKEVADMPPSKTVVSIDRLLALVPEAKEFGFGSDEYLPDLLDRYVGPVREDVIVSEKLSRAAETEVRSA